MSPCWGAVKKVPVPLFLPEPQGGTTIASFRDEGHGRAVLLVHGILAHRGLAELVRLAEALAERHDVLSIDTRGHGDDTRPFTWGREEWTQVDAAARYLARDGRPPAVVGFSYGGFHAARAAGRGMPVSRLVLVGAPYDLRVYDPLPSARRFLKHLPGLLRRRRRRSRFEVPRRLTSMIQHDAEVASIGAPALVVHSEDDWLIPRRHAERYARTLRDARLVEIAGGLHAEHLLREHLGEFVETVEGFLAGFAAGSRVT